MDAFAKFVKRHEAKPATATIAKPVFAADAPAVVHADEDTQPLTNEAVQEKASRLVSIPIFHGANAHRALHSTAAILLAAQTLIFALLSVDMYAQLIQAMGEMRPVGGWFPAAVVQDFNNMNVRWLLTAISGIGALYHTVMALWWWFAPESAHDAVDGERCNSMRWITEAVNHAMAMIIVAVLVGVNDVYMLIMLGGLIGASVLVFWGVEMFQGQLPEEEGFSFKRRAILFFWSLALVLNAVVWACLFRFFYNIFNHQALMAVPWYSQVVIWCVGLGLVTVIFLALTFYRFVAGGFESSTKEAFSFSVLSFVWKVVLVWSLFGALRA